MLSTSNNKINCESKNNKKNNSQNATKDLIEIKKENCSSLQSTKFNNENLVNYKERVCKNSCKSFLCCNSAKANKTKTLNTNNIKNYFNKKSNTYAISNKIIIKSTIMLLLWLFVFVMSLTMVCCLSTNKSNLNEVDAVSGTAITTADELKAVADNLSGSYYLANDIIVNDNTWKPIGTSSSSAFKGIFDGNGHTITFTQTIYITSNSGNVYGGLFGYVVGTSSTQKAEIKNLGVNWAGTGNVSISVGAENETYAGLVVSSSSIAYAGGIVGRVSSNAIISNCYNTGDVSAISTTSIAYAGGIAGGTSNTTISNCYNKGSVTATSISSYAKAGGIVGDGGSLTKISNCYNKGSVTATSTYSASAGGISGGTYDTTINNCYNTGDVTATSTSSASAGGIVGGISRSTIRNCFSIGTAPSATANTTYVGGIVGNGSTVSYSYHNYGEDYGNDTTKYTTICDQGLKDKVKDLDEFKKITWYDDGTDTYDWNFTSIWAINTSVNNGYPILRDLSNVTITYQTDKDDNSQNQTQPINLVVDSNVTLKGNTTFSKLGYSYTQWTDGTNYYNCGSTQLFEQNIILYPVWQANTYDLTFEQDGGTNGAPNTTITHGSTLIDSVAIPTKTGYTFLGYYLDNIQFYNASGELVNTSYIVTGALSLTAKWSRNYTIVTFKITTNVGVIFNVYDESGNFVQQMFVDKKSGEQTLTTNLMSQSYTVLISTVYTANIALDSLSSGVTLSGRVLNLIVGNSNNDIIMYITGFGGGNSIVV